MASLRLRRILTWAILTIIFGASVSGRERGWRKVVTTNFTVITDAGDSDAVAWAADFAEFVAGFQQYIHVDTTRLPQLTIVLFSHASEFRPYRPMSSEGKPEDVAGFFSRRESWAVAGLAGLEMDEETRRTIFHEGTHWILSADELPNPVWLEEGVAEVFSTFEINAKQVIWGAPIAEHIGFLRSSGAIPLEKLLFTAQEELFAGGTSAEERTNTTYAQSWLFVHYLMFGKNDMPEHALATYVKLLRTMDPDKAFQTAFGHGYKDVDRKLGDYLDGGHYYTRHEPRLIMKLPRAEPASAAEVEDALGRLALVAQHRDLAQQHARKFAELSPDDPRTYELLGLVAEENGEDAAAVVQYRAAIAHKSEDYRPYFEVAHAEHTAAEDYDGAVRGMADADARRIINNYERALQRNPRFKPAYESIAALLPVVDLVNSGDKVAMENGHLLYPNDAQIRIGAAVVAYGEGRIKDAHEALNAVRNMSPAPPTHALQYAERLEDSWTRNEATNQLNELAQSGKFRDAIALADQQLAVATDVSYKMELTELRKNYVLQQKLAAIREGWEDHRWRDVRLMLNELMRSDASEMLKMQARSQLQKLDQMHLGLPKQTDPVEKAPGADADATTTAAQP